MDIIYDLSRLDTNMLIWLNSFHSPFWDQFMILITGKAIWIPFYLLIALAIYRNFGRAWWIILLSIGCTIACADLFASSLLKPGIERLRPCHVETLQEILHMPAGCGGKFGFISSHSSNTFALATFLFLLFRNRYRYIGLLFIWATAISYSRVYLAVHYPGDIIAGMISGSLWAALFYYICKVAVRRYIPKAG